MDMTDTNAPDLPAARLGRQPSTSLAALSHIALELFKENGFENTTVDAVALAAGIGRRTLFRYVRSKNDLPWGDFGSGLDQMREHLASMPADTPLVQALTAAVIEFNRFPVEEIPVHRERMHLLLTVPALVAHSTLRYAAWREVVAEYAAARLHVDIDDIAPQAIAWAFLGGSLAAYEQWLRHDDANLLELLATAFAELSTIFADSETRSPAAHPGSLPPAEHRSD
jgi:mycofactocin system transcriptional regulator